MVRSRQSKQKSDTERGKRDDVKKKIIGKICQEIHDAKGKLASGKKSYLQDSSSIWWSLIGKEDLIF